MTALEAKGCIAAQQPTSFRPMYLNRDNIQAFYFEQKPCGGWVANVAFRNVPAGQPDVLGMPEAYPFETQEGAFMAGASIVCVIVTGSRELPFFFSGNQLICAVYRLRLLCPLSSGSRPTMVVIWTYRTLTRRRKKKFAQMIILFLVVAIDTTSLPEIDRPAFRITNTA